MSQDFWWVVLGAGVGTYLLRYLPMRRSAQGESAASDSPLKRFLIALGPAAITALIVVSLWPSLTAAQPLMPIVITVIAMLALWLCKRRFGGIALPTLAGVAVYALLRYWLGG